MHRNGVKTVALLGLTSAGIVIVGTRFGGVGTTVAVVAVVGLNGFVYLRSDALMLRAMRAYPVGEAEQPALHQVVRELSTRARLPMPRVYVSPTRAATAFATGRDPAHASVCCTEGLLDLLDERELRAVVAHELAHIRRRDTLLATAVGALAVVIMTLTALSFLIPGGEDDDGPGVVGALLLAVLGPAAAGLVAVAVARSREYDADAEAARLTGDPVGLAKALRALDASSRRLVLPPERRVIAASHLMIANPLPRTGLARLFSSHPRTADRVSRLEQLAGYRR